MTQVLVNHMHKNTAFIGRKQQGVTSIEYALLASFIVLAILAGVTAVGGSNASLWAGWTNRVIAALTP